MATATTFTTATAVTTTTTTTTKTASSSTRHQTQQQQQQQQQQQLLPPLSVKPSISMQSEDSVFSRLGATPLPDKEINAILNLHENLSLSQVLIHFDACMDKMTRWLETAQMAVFTLELQLKEGGSNNNNNNNELLQHYYDDYENDHLLELAFGRMEPLISILVEVGHILEDKLDMEGDDYNGGGGVGTSGANTKKMHTRMAITKVQSEWSGLQHFMSSVLKQLDTMNEKKELTLLMENVLQQIDDLSIMMFQFQEKRHAAAAAAATTTAITAATANGIAYNLDTQNDVMGSPISTTSSLFSPSTTTTTTTATGTTAATSVVSSIHSNEPLSSSSAAQAPRDEHILAEIDSKVEPLFNDVQRIYASMTSPSPPEDPSGMLTRKHHMVQHRWEALRIEIDDLKEELKEDRWLTVFRQVADQVDVMIDGLDKTVTQCYTIIDQVREWYHATYQQQQSSQGNAFNRFSKSIMRSFPRHHSSSSTTTANTTSSSSTTATAMPPPMDPEKFRSVEKNFEAKNKYYTPSIGKMLHMLGSGIVSRVAHNNGTSKRHASMMQRWTTLKTSMDTLRNKDLPETERMLSELMHTPKSPGGWKSIRYKSPEPSHHQQGEALLRAKSAHSNNNTLPKTNFAVRGYNNNTNHYHHHQEQEDYRRTAGVRSVTPSGGRMFHSKVTQQQQHHQYHPPRAASSMAYARDIRPSASESSSIDSYPVPGRKTMTPIGTSHHESRSFATTATCRKSRVPGRNGEDKEEATWMKPTKSTLLRTARRAQSVDQGMRRSESPSRPKTPVQRSKTPNPGYTRRKSTTPNVPSRPKSSLGRQQQQLTVPNKSNDYELDRSMSPIPRRTMTPSLIPRPKTPSSSAMRCESPSLIPRPRSSMQQHHPSPPPPIPPIPASFYQDQYQQQQQPSLKKKQSMPALMHRTTSPFRMTHVPMRAPSPQYRRRRLSEDGHGGGRDGIHGGDFSLIRGHHPRSNNQHHQHHEVYTPNPRDPLDMEVARIVNASPISVKCQKGPLGGGRYFFGNELSPSVGGGKKLYTCKLMTYENNTQRRSKAAHPPQNKVLVRVGGGWQDLEMFLLDHSNLMTATTASEVGGGTTPAAAAVVPRFK
ncbi:hypothetical protein BDB00DRAFT_827993 [Zychaea mexicana]|uniref:uncharacterized protein n=1 Tax=Zychaea mexicana TaxID=64656 RepID=UPI0022FE8EC8|nr:uncharacterized protein BDB00DRAFT_827993 [Zychaea mexicana]KAI9492572.1 hypothetical protein BDB00DRAFT_827993 [Zychaea mexicana]